MLVGCWMLALMDFKGLVLSSFLRDWVTVISCSQSPMPATLDLVWKPPPVDTLKLNFDGASKGNPAPTGFRCVLRDHNGCIARVLCVPLGICNSTKAKTCAMLFGLREF